MLIAIICDYDVIRSQYISTSIHVQHMFKPLPRHYAVNVIRITDCYYDMMRIVSMVLPVYITHITYIVFVIFYQVLHIIVPNIQHIIYNSLAELKNVFFDVKKIP